MSTHSSPLTNLSEEQPPPSQPQPIPFSLTPPPTNIITTTTSNHRSPGTSFETAPTPLAYFDPPSEFTCSPTIDTHHHFNLNSNQKSPSKFTITTTTKSIENNHQEDEQTTNQQSETNPIVSNPLASIKIKRNSITKKSKSNQTTNKPIKKSKVSSTDQTQQTQSPSTLNSPKSEKKRKSTTTNPKEVNNPPSLPDSSTPQSKPINPNKRTNLSQSSNTSTPIAASSTITTTTTKRPNKSTHSKLINPSNKKQKTTNHNHLITPGHPNPNASLNKSSTGEFDLNDPNCWGALFGGGSEKKSIEKPNKKPIGNIPRTTTTFLGTSAERLMNRSKQRSDQRQILFEQNQTGFDLMQQATEMMNFEIDYKIHVRDIASKPIPPHTRLENPRPQSPIEPPPASSVVLRPGGYKRFTLPPPQVAQSNGMVYTTNSVEVERRRVLPRPSLFGSSFFIWQKSNLPA